MIRGINRYARETGRLSCFHAPPEYFHFAAQGAIYSDGSFGTVTSNVRGIILTNELRDFDEITKLDLPMIIHRMTRQPVAPFPRILGDNAAVGEMAAEHMLERGFRNFGFCGNNVGMASRERFESFSNYITGAGYQVSCHLHPLDKLLTEWQDQFKALGKWLRELPKPVAILAANDQRAHGIVRCCLNMGLSIPEDVAVLGVDNEKVLCETTTPTLSSVALGHEQAGYEAAALLYKLITGKAKMESQRILVHPTEVVQRQSTNVMLIADQDVVKAIGFIRANAARIVDVNDVAKAAAVSRCTLERKFKTILNKTVSGAIKRYRVEHVCRLLAETDMSISEIATSLGYEDGQHFSRFFKLVKKTTPLAYRKKFCTPNRANIKRVR